MNTEPPTGDDLRRMLVSMKQTVLERSSDRRPARHGRQAGIVAGVVAIVLLGSAGGAVALGVVPQPFESGPRAGSTESPSPSTTSSPASSASLTPEPVRTNAPTAEPVSATIPSDCHAAVPAADYDRLFGATPLEQLRPTPSGRTAESVPAPTDGTGTFLGEASLYCLWSDPRSDVSGLSVGAGTAQAAVLAAYEADLRAQGYSCSAAQDGEVCQVDTPADPYPVNTTTTFFVRGTTWIDITQTNTPTNNLLASLVSVFWQ